MRRFSIWMLLALLAAGTRAQGELEATTVPFIGGDPERGRLVFASCRSCHYTDSRLGHGNGPNLHRIFGRTAGKQPGFDYYSPQLQAAEFVWTPQVLYAWLENPMQATPGTTMMSNGVPDPGQRADLVAYLQQVSMLEFAP
jgi:cytochrome c